jgi:glyoxylase-like metal-dependent hydrolase (beta-lactamase superfamily II)
MFGSAERFLEGFALGMWQANCYVLGDAERGTAVVVDPGQDGAEVVQDCLARRGVVCEAILCTHGHLDHVWAVPELAESLDVPILLHPDDRYMWDNPAKAFGDLPMSVLQSELGLDWDPPSDRLQSIADAQSLALVGLSFEVRHTPGHTPGSSVFLVRPVEESTAEPLLLSGDLVFAGSVGRTDFPGGSWEDHMASIKRAVLPLPDETAVHSGHGPATTVGAERRSNPFLREIV